MLSQDNILESNLSRSLGPEVLSFHTHAGGHSQGTSHSPECIIFRSSGVQKTKSLVPFGTYTAKRVSEKLS